MKRLIAALATLVISTMAFADTTETTSTVKTNEAPGVTSTSKTVVAKHHHNTKHCGKHHHCHCHKG